MGMVEEFVGPDGRLRFITTGTFLTHFGLASLGDLQLQWTMEAGTQAGSCL